MDSSECMISKMELMETTLIESASLSALPQAGHMFGHLLLVDCPVLMINQVLLAMTLFVTDLHIVMMILAVDLFFGSLSSMEGMCLLCSKNYHFLTSVTLK